MVFVADDDDVVSCKAFFFHDPVDFQDEGAGHIYIRDVFFFQLIVDGFTYAVRADDYCSVLQGVIRGIQVCFCDNMDATGFQIRYYAFIVDDRTQSEDWFLFCVDQLVDFVYCPFDAEAEPAVSATFTFITNPLNLYSLPFFWNL